MLRAVGADLVGMSTVHETIAARAAGVEVLGVSLVTNMAAGITGESLSHVEVLETGAGSAAGWVHCWPMWSHGSSGSRETRRLDSARPDPVTAAELAGCDGAELAARFARPLTFGTAGLRGPVRGGPDAMNVAVVLRASWAVAKVLTGRGLAGSTVIVGRDARHGSAAFAAATAEVFAAEGFSVMLLPRPVPTPVLAFAVRHTGAAAGVQITASHNPPADNGYKVYLDGGIQIVSPTDREIESAMRAAPFADEIATITGRPRRLPTLVPQLHRARRRSTALVIGHGPSGADPAARGGWRGGSRYAAGCGFRRCAHRRRANSAPTPTSRPSGSPIPKNRAPPTNCWPWPPGRRRCRDRARPDADRCAVGIPTPAGWRMLSGDETGWLLGDYILSHIEAPQRAASVVASTVVSSRMLAAIAAHWGARHVETLTGFKWLARADAELPGSTLVYAYEEAIGHCVDPAAVRDKDGISAAVLVCDLVATLKRSHRTVPDALDDLARRFGVHAGCRGVAPGLRCRRGGRADAPTSVCAARSDRRIRLHHNGSDSTDGRADLHRR